MPEGLLEILESRPPPKPLTPYERREIEKDWQRVMAILTRDARRQGSDV